MPASVRRPHAPQQPALTHRALPCQSPTNHLRWPCRSVDLGRCDATADTDADAMPCCAVLCHAVPCRAVHNSYSSPLRSVDLGRAYAIDHIVIYGRGDCPITTCNPPKLRNLFVYVGDEPVRQAGRQAARGTNWDQIPLQTPQLRPPSTASVPCHMPLFSRPLLQPCNHALQGLPAVALTIRLPIRPRSPQLLHRCSRLPPFPPARM